MLGWHITVYTKKNNKEKPAKFGEDTEHTLAVWQTGLYGLDWIMKLVEANAAINLGGNGYPYEFTTQKKTIAEAIQSDPPHAKKVWSFDAGDVIMPGWKGTTTINLKLLEKVKNNEWLLIRAWDES